MSSRFLRAQFWACLSVLLLVGSSATYAGAGEPRNYRARAAGRLVIGLVPEGGGGNETVIDENVNRTGIEPQGVSGGWILPGDYGLVTYAASAPYAVDPNIILNAFSHSFADLDRVEGEWNSIVLSAKVDTLSELRINSIMFEPPDTEGGVGTGGSFVVRLPWIARIEVSQNETARGEVLISATHQGAYLDGSLRVRGGGEFVGAGDFAGLDGSAVIASGVAEIEVSYYEQFDLVLRCEASASRFRNNSPSSPSHTNAHASSGLGFGRRGQNARGNAVYTLFDDVPDGARVSSLDGFLTDNVFGIPLEIKACGPDINNDAVVNIDDLAILLTVWQSRELSFDLTGDFVMDADDLAVLLASWGDCEK